MARIILHVGTHKTGTTALQRALFAQQDLLLKCGVSYDPWQSVLLGLKSSHHGFAQRLARFNSDDQTVLVEYRLRLEQALAQGLDVIISAESFYRHVDARVLDDPDAARISFLDRVVDYFSGLPIEVSICFRRPDSMADSMFREHTVSSNSKLEFLDYLECFSDRFDYSTRLAEFEMRFKTVKIWCFEDAVAKGLMPAFLELHELQVPGIIDAKADRKSISARAVMWLQLAKQSVECMSTSERKTRWYYAASPHAHSALVDPHPEGFWPDAKTRDDFLLSKLSDFRFADFWNMPVDIPPLVRWSAEEHNTVEGHFNKWNRANSVLLKMRKRAKLAPYEADRYIPIHIRIKYLYEFIKSRFFNAR